MASAVDEDRGRFRREPDPTLFVNAARFLGSLGRFFPFRFDALETGVDTEAFAFMISFAFADDGGVPT